METKTRMSPVRGPLQASDVMTQQVECVDVGQTMEEVARLFTGRKISAAPVIGANGQPVGVISKSDITRYQISRDHFPLGRPGHFVSDPSAETVRWWLTPAILSVFPDMSFHRVVDMMIKHNVHHIFVRERTSERICGVISSLDVVRSLRRLGRHSTL